MTSKILPKLVVFDLDYTLWPFWIDTHVTPPFRKDKNIIVDLHGSKVDTYKESTLVLQKLGELKCDMAVASRTSEIDGANQLIKLLDWESFFKYKEIYPGCKVSHFKQWEMTALPGGTECLRPALLIT
ncbi:unnamed protein product [Nezara viridula]|uniref:Magnesium-dependent phosphatase 1 n=1 Tax=Nezara viridula TaxID=85310 RepID=A0A9P0E3F5_NEZVI|nr:unnamed protein product [Nezara viridula]